MATFEYQALTSAGRLMTGTIEAPSHDQADNMLEEMKLKVNSLTQTRSPKVKTKIGHNEFVLFNQQLASLTKAGLPLERSLRELAHDVSSSRMCRLINEIASELEQGDAIEKPFEKRKSFFPHLYGHILKAGVQTGRLSEMLISMNRHLEMIGQTRKIIFEAICYPAVVFCLAAVILTGIFTLVIPQFQNIFGDMDIGLPLLTQVFMYITAQQVLIFWLIVVSAITSLVLTWKILSCFPAGRIFEESVLIKTPVLGRVYHNSILSRLADAMALLIGTGCDLGQAFSLAASATGSEKLQRDCRNLAEGMERGNGIMEIGQLSATIPRLFFYSVQLGAQRNELQDNLHSLSEMYAEQARGSQAKLSAVLLPALIIMVGGIIALMVLALFLPMISTIENLS